MTWVGLVNWAIVLALVVILWTDYQAIRYFRRQERILGPNWVLHEYLRTAWSFLFVYAIFTAARIATLIGPTGADIQREPIRVIAGVAVGIAFLWVGLTPYRHQRLFRSHEGRP